jgi:hypothetical protein
MGKVEAVGREDTQMPCGPVCLSLIQGIPAGLVAAVATVIGAKIASHQTTVAAAKLKLDLFDKRYPIFLDTWKIMSEVVSKGTREKNYGLGTPFNNFMPQARFLFGEDIERYLSEAANKWIDLHTIESVSAEGGPRPADYPQKRTDLFRWFKEEADTGIKKRFDPYLDFEKWR